LADLGALLENKLMSVILCIESDENQRLMLNKLLASPDFRIVMARDGLEGMAKARLLRPDMILIDLELPHMDGLAVITQLKMYSPTRNIPIIFISDLPADYSSQLVQDTGVQGFIVKPVVSRELLEIIQKHLPPDQNHSTLAHTQ
jgi:CheY-like chemotaxis protein